MNPVKAIVPAWLYAICVVLSTVVWLVGARTYLHAPGKTGLEGLALSWWVVLCVMPVLGSVCFLMMWLSFRWSAEHRIAVITATSALVILWFGALAFFTGSLEYYAR